MEVLLIGEAKLKIVLTEDEVRKYKLDISEPCKDTAKTRRGLWSIIEAARGKVSFDPSGDKVLIQLYPTKSGGCEMFVTKLGILSPASAKLVSGSDKITLLTKKRGFYHFENIESAVAAVKAIKKHPSGVTPRGDIYITDRGTLILSVDEYGRGDDLPEFPALLEYGERLSAEMACYISEHYIRCTDGDALERVSALF